MARTPGIPNCYDPAHQAEQREAEWDRFVEQLSVCTLCRERIFPGSKVHTAHFMAVCSSCVEILNDDYEILEDPS
jgi:hypothetical protein